MKLTISRSLSIALLSTLGTGASANDTYTTATGKSVSTLDVFQECGECPEMVVLPMGSFVMGSTVKEANAAQIRFHRDRNVDTAHYENKLRDAFNRIGIDPDDPEEGLRRYYASGNVVRYDDPQYSANPFLHEVPPHPVLIDRPIAMGRNEVTREEWAACVEDGWCENRQHDVPRSAFPSCEQSSSCVPTPDARIRFRLPNGPYPTHPRAPRTGITYYEMNDYTSWLNEKVGADVYRVPTEAEWEYAARAGTTTRYAQGDTLTLEQANFGVYRRELVNGEYVWNDDLGSAKKLLPVDALDAANDWGLRHMSGNASEFTSSCGEGPHRGLATSSQYLDADAKRPDCKRALKGGMYRVNVEMARLARRVSISSHNWSHTRGFRVVRDLAPIK